MLKLVNSWQIICNFLTVYLLKLYYLGMIAYLRHKMHKYSNQCSCTSKQTKRFTPQWSHFTYWIQLFFFCEHFSLWLILSPQIWQFCTFFLNVVIKCNCYKYIITCWCMEYIIVCKYVERAFVSWNNLGSVQMLYS